MPYTVMVTIDGNTQVVAMFLHGIHAESFAQSLREDYNENADRGMNTDITVCKIGEVIFEC